MKKPTYDDKFKAYCRIVKILRKFDLENRKRLLRQVAAITLN